MIFSEVIISEYSKCKIHRRITNLIQYVCIFICLIKLIIYAVQKVQFLHSQSKAFREVLKERIGNLKVSDKYYIGDRMR